MKLLVGLGNPGAQYAGNRHNIGFMAADAIAAGHGFPAWRQKFQGSLAEGRIATVRTLILKPETFMNLSGDAVQAAMRFFKITPADVIVFHDELDLAPGKLRVKTGGGHAGHNGLRSIDAHIGPNFTRVRMGIGHPGDKRLVSNYVLSDFDRADAGWLEAVLAGVREGAPDLVARDRARFLGAVARRLATLEPERPAASQAAAAPPRPESEPAPAVKDERSALQKLADRFR